MKRQFSAMFRYFSIFLLFCSLFSFSSLSTCVRASDADSLYKEGMSYLQSDSAVQDVAKGIAMIVEAADSGSAKAMVQVGVLYSSGLGKLVSEDFEEGDEADLALSWYVKGAEAGERALAASAISSDAFTYFLGSEERGIQEDDATALKFFEKAAEYGDPEAINMMVAFYTYGFGVEQDPVKALELSSQLADQGNTEALISMEENAYAYYAGNKDGIDINFSTAFQYYLKLTEYGNERAMYNVGLLYEYGLGVTADHDKAIEWLTKAKDAGYTPATTMLEQLSGNK